MQEQAGPDRCRVTIENTGQSFVCGRDELILDAGLVAGIGLPHNCRGGACGTCKSQVIEGSVDHGWVMSFAIADEEKAAGKCLICQSKPTSDRLVIRTDGAMAPVEDAPPASIETTTGRIVASEVLTPSVRRLVVALPAGVRFRFRAGMHVEIATPGVAKARTYSIACAPDGQGVAPDGLLEFFVTRHREGRASCWLHDVPIGQSLAVHGPYGGFHWPVGASGRVLCLAGGSGLAPILSALRAALTGGYADPVRLVLSVRDHSEVFGLDACHALARRHANFSYRVTLSRVARVDPDLGWRAGRIAEWLPHEMPDLSGSWVLCAGPPGFVEACVAVAKAQGARDGRILTDSFTPTPEAPNT